MSNVLRLGTRVHIDGPVKHFGAGVTSIGARGYDGEVVAVEQTGHTPVHVKLNAKHNGRVVGTAYKHVKERGY